MGYAFEEAAREYVAGLATQGLLPFLPDRIGRWWDRQAEIDVVAISDSEGAVLVGECKWSNRPVRTNILDDLKLSHTKITGDDSADDRKKARLAFQDASQEMNTIFITSAGSAALNLQAANVILFYDTPWSYGDLYQTIGRAQRIGSIYEHIHLIHMVNSKSIDEHVLQILESKKSLINDIMGDIAEGAIDFKDDVVFKDDESSIDALFTSVFG